jgi:CHAT domain-containing protein/tetratricopeptide (TPR) repeat protein
LVPHLDSSQIEELLRSSGRDDDSVEEDSANDQIDANARLHLNECYICQMRVRAEGEAMERLAQLKPSETAARSPQCPPDSVWLELAAGIHADPESLLAHASQCDHCAPLLNDALADLTSQLTGQEDAEIARLPSIHRNWQGDLARRIAGGGAESAAGPELVSPPSDHAPRRRRIWPPYAVAAMVLILLSTWAVLHWLPNRSAQVLLADAYSQHRTLELRIPGAKQSPVHLERGTQSSNLDKPGSLLQAEAIIAEGLRKNPHSVEFLDAKARADLIDGNFDSAIQTVQRAMETQPLSPVLMTDLATAYFARAEATGQAIDYGRAIDNLGKVLAASPDDSLALFNRALTEERMFLYDDAVADWQHFLRVELDPAWRDEGRQRLQDLRHTMEERKHSSVGPLHDPSAAVAALSLHSKSTQAKSWPRTFDEGYLDIATTEWLQTINNNSAAWSAWKTLSEQFRQRHHDDWLAELVHGPHTQAWAEGSRELAAAFRADSTGDVRGIVSHAQESIGLFRSAGNQAGEAGARLEYLVGLNRSERGHDCLAAANRALEQTDNHHYPWVEISVLYELSTCDFLNGNPLAAIESARRAKGLAETAQYPVLELDGLNYLDGVTPSWVASSEAWNRIRSGLRVFWQDAYPPGSGADFYADLGLAAETEEMWRTAERAGRETILTNSLGGDRLREAVAHHRLAQIGEAAGDTSLADAEYESAGAAFKSSGTESRAATITLEIERAALEVREGRFGLAATRLGAIHDRLTDSQAKLSFTRFSKQYDTILYLETLGELHFHLGKPDLAKAELLEAIRLIETNQDSLNSDIALAAWQHNNQQAYKSMIELYLRTYHDPVRSLALLEWSRAAPLRTDQTFHEKNLMFHDSQQELSTVAYLPGHTKWKTGTAVITWMTSPRGLAIWIVDNTGVHTAWVNVSQDRLENNVEMFARLCADPLSDTNLIDKDARQLYQWLLQPVSGALRGATTLVIEPDGRLNALPFQALKSQTGEYVGDCFLIIESPGLGYSKLLRSDRAVSPKSMILAVGNPLLNATDNLASLPYADKEAHDISRKFTRYHLLTGSEATTANVLQWLPQADVFHFAGHMLSQGHEPGLLLAPGETGQTALLGEEQLQPQQMKNLKLAVLSACDTALADGGLEDPGNLVRLFLRAGVPQVIASKWSVDSAASSELMENLYAHLFDGDSVELALANVERAMRSRTETSHPYYWAAFSEFGAS